jgi:prepilin-type processing-associated H-X9-DG protein
MGVKGTSNSGYLRRDMIYKKNIFEYPEQVIMCGDNLNADKYSASYPYNFSFRHGSGDSRQKSGVNYLNDYNMVKNNSKCNFLYVDTHVESKTKYAFPNFDGKYIYKNLNNEYLCGSSIYSGSILE